MSQVRLRSLEKRYGSLSVVKGIDLEIAEREFIALVGPSGCGKSTTLRMIAGLEEISGGQVLIGDKIVNGVPPKDRNIAMVFQNYALYPHMTVAANMSFGLELRKTPRVEIDRRVKEAAKILNIEELLERKPRQLSGGQRQRVAMGRAIVRDPTVFLFDEPLSNLDANLRAQMRIEIKKLHRRLQATTIYVTHDQVEAMTLADRIVVMNKGSIDQVGTPHDLYHHPATKFVAGFIGSPAMNFIPCSLESRSEKLLLRISDEIAFPIPPERVARYGQHAERGPLLLGLRPENISDPSQSAGPDRHAFQIPVDEIEPMGMDTLVYFVINGIQACGRVSPRFAAAQGNTITLLADLSGMHLIESSTGRVL